MSNASLGLEQQILQHTLGIAPMAATTQVYVALCQAAPAPTEATGGVEVSGGGYARQRATFALLASPPDMAANTISLEFPRTTADWGTLGYFELWPELTGGSRLYWGPLVDPTDTATPLTLNVVLGDVVRVAAGALTVRVV
jgi:hypothetical protein